MTENSTKRLVGFKTFTKEAFEKKKKLRLHCQSAAEQIWESRGGYFARNETDKIAPNICCILKILCFQLDPCWNVTCMPPRVCKVSARSGARCVCDVKCPLAIAASDAVCGSDGKTYSSGCFLKQRSCQAGQDVKVVRRGPCPSLGDVVITVQKMLSRFKSN